MSAPVRPAGNLPVKSNVSEYCSPARLVISVVMMQAPPMK